MRRLSFDVFVRLTAVAMLAASGVAAASAVKTIRIESIGGEPTPPGKRTFAPDPARTALVEQDVVDERSLDELPYEAGRIVLKLSETLASQGRAIEGRSVATSFGIAALDRIGRRYGLRSIRRPFANRDARAAARSNETRSRSARARAGAVAPTFETVHLVEISPFLDMEAVAREYATVDGVLWAEPVRKVQALMATNDPYLTSSGAWGQPFRDLWGLDKIDAQSAWDVTRGAGMVVAVTDTGLDAAHPEISQRVWTNAGEVAGNGLDDDGNGYVDDTAGWDFVNVDNDPFDDNGHGTHVSGTIAAQGNNGTGIVGVAWESRVMPLKGLSGGGSGSTTGLAEAILYAVDNGADVINASWGGTGTSELIDDTVEAAAAAGVVFVAAAGNSATDVSTFFPASNPHAIAVSAFDSTDTVAYFSNFGAKIDVAAPGGGDSLPSSIYDPFRSVLSLLSSGANSDLTGGNRLKIGTLYLRQAGTSMAAPHVAGAAALVLANHPEFTVEQVRQALRASSDDVDAPGVDANSGYGRINVGTAVAIDDVLEVTIDGPVSGDTVSTNQLSIAGTVGGNGFASYSVEVGEGEYPTSWTGIVGPVATPVTAGQMAVWDTTSVADGSYAVRVLGRTVAGDVFEDRVQLTLDRVIITEPTSYSIHRGGGAQIQIVGTAYGPGMQSYVVEYRAIEPDLTEGAWTMAGLTLTGGGTQPVFEDVLATFNSSVLPAGRDLDLRLTVNGSEGATSDSFYHIVVDPDLRGGWPVQIPGLPDRYARMQGHVTLADLDNNGTKEIVAGYGDLVFVFNADGSDVPGWPQSMAEPDPDFHAFTDAAPAAADLDNDGTLEVVSGNRRSVFIWHHDGAPMAGWPKEFVYQPDYYVRGVPSGNFTLVDLDGDGTRDILFGWGAAIAAVRTDGSFLPGWPPTVDSIYLSPPPFEKLLAAGDMNADGKPEVAIVESAGSRSPQYLHVLDALGQELEGYPVKITRRRFSDNWPIMADLDGNGLLDVITNRDNPKKLNAYDWEGRKVRLKSKVPAYKYRYPGAGKFKSAQELLSAGDITGDGRPEVFVSTEWPQVRIKCHGFICTWTFLLGPYTGTSYVQAVSANEREIAGWPRQLDFRRGDNAHGPGSAAIGDVDGDGGQDVVLGTGMCWAGPNYEYHRCYTILAYRADGTSLPGFPKPTPSPGATQAVMPAIGDLDGDGLKEIVWIDFNGNVLVWTVPGTGGPENMQWPMFRHDAAHTGALR